MRAICLALLVINLLAFGAQLVVGDPEQAISSQRQPISAAGRELRLLSELADGDLPVAPRTEAGRQPTSEPFPRLDSQPLCTLVGPFAQASAAENLVARLASLDMAARAENIEVSDGVGYWVYLDPELSQNAALRRLHELQSKNIDSYIIPRGDLALGISLGMFSRQELALGRQKELSGLGYDAKIEEISRTHREIWISLSSEEAAQLADGFWTELLSQDPELEKRQNFCPGVASSTKFH